MEILPEREKKIIVRRKTGKTCAAYGCGAKHTDGVSIHKFPDQPHLRRQWINFVKTKRKDFSAMTLTPNTYLCGQHFTDECFPIEYRHKKTMNLPVRRITLLPDAVPTIQPVLVSQSTTIQKSIVTEELYKRFYRHKSDKTRPRSAYHKRELHRILQNSPHTANTSNTSSTSNTSNTTNTPNTTNMDSKALTIEGYQVFKEDENTSVMVKQEPLDPDYADHNSAKHTEKEAVSRQDTDSAVDGNMGKTLKSDLSAAVRLNTGSFIEGLVERNYHVLQQTLTMATLKSQGDVSTTVTNHNKEQLGKNVQLNEPAVTCTTGDTSVGDVNTALVERGVDETSDTFDEGLVCAVASKVHICTAQGAMLQMDVTCYWCNFCNFKSDRKEVILQHMTDHKFHCKYCTFQSLSRAAVIHHCTETHEEFKEVAPTLKYCYYLPDIVQKTEAQQNKKRKLEDQNDDKTESEAKVARNDELFHMEVDEVAENGEVSTATGEKIIIPTQEKIVYPRKHTPRSTLPAPVQNVKYGSIPVPVQQLSENQLQQSSSDPSVITSTTGLPVIASVYSGQQAVEAAHTIKPSTTTTPTALPASVHKPISTLPETTATVSSGLCWSCGYCPFTTLNQSFLKIHLNGEHKGKPHKYVALLVSNKEEMDKIKKSDSTLLFNAPKNSPTPIKTASTVEVNKTASADVPNKEAPVNDKGTKPTELIRSEEVKVKDMKVKEEVVVIPAEEETEVEKQVPVSYKCAHCNFSGTEPEKIKMHLRIRHMGCVMYILDMRAVKLRKKRYLFFCLKKTCNFMTKEAEDYVKHITECIPESASSTGSSTEGSGGMDEVSLKSITLTKQFIEKTQTQPTKTSSSSSIGRQDQVAEYGCLYCSYSSNNNTRLKKHVLSNHQHMPTSINNLYKGTRAKVNFCRHCLWETREENTLGRHLKENHWLILEKQGIDLNDIEANGEVRKKAKTDKKDTSKDKEDTTTVTASKAPADPPVPVVKAVPVVNNNVSVNNNISVNNNTSVDSAENSRDGSVEGSTRDNEDHTDDEQDTSEMYAGVVSKTEYDKALSIYMAHTDINSPGSRSSQRPARTAAKKAQIKNKLLKPPTLYRCYHCNTHIAFGTVLMRIHLRNTKEHKNLPLIMHDLLKKENNKPNALMYLCPVDKCVYSAAFASDVVNHAKNAHGMRPTNPDLLLLTNHSLLSQSQTPIRKRKATPATGESYECLYCTDESVIVYSRIDMKRHLIEKHENEEFLYRDCIARKLQQASRLYMCHDLTCDTTFHTQQDYQLHLLAHKKSTIYECPKCNYFSVDNKSSKQHLTSSHTETGLQALKIDLDLDEFGNLRRMIGGTVIKTEK